MRTFSSAVTVLLILLLSDRVAQALSKNKDPDREQRQVGVGASNLVGHDDVVRSEKESLETKCKVFDACRACSFKEL